MASGVVSNQPSLRPGPAAPGDRGGPLGAPAGYIGLGALSGVAWAILPSTGEVVFAGSTGVRLKGSVGSYRDLDQKAGFKVDLGQYDGSQALFGAQKFTFNNCVQDSSYVRQWATYEVLRQSGFPAPRVGYANIYVNGELYGLYLHLETTDESFVNRYFPNTKLLYEGQPPTEFDLDNWGNFQRDIGSATDGALLANLVNVLGTLPRTETWAVAEPFVDRDQVTLDFAVEAWVGHWDGYAFNNNNFL
jgi:spore coat protein CotH